MTSNAKAVKPKGSAKGICSGYLEYRVVKLLDTKILKNKSMASKKNIFGLITGAVIIAGVVYYLKNNGKRKTITKAPTSVEVDNMPEVEEVVNDCEMITEITEGIESVHPVPTDIIENIENVKETELAFRKAILELVLIPENKDRITTTRDLLSVVAHKCVLCFQFQPIYLEKIPINEEQLVALLEITGTYGEAAKYLKDDIDRLEKLSTKCEELEITKKIGRKLNKKKFVSYQN